MTLVRVIPACRLGVVLNQADRSVCPPLSVPARIRKPPGARGA